MSKVVKVVAAAAVGFVAGILLAPKSGKETRADIKAKAEELKDGAEKKLNEVKKAGERAVNDGKKTVEEYADKAKRASDAAKKELNK